MFTALKSWEFDLEDTHVTKPGKSVNLIGLLALAFVWARLVGEERCKAGRHFSKPMDGRSRACFSMG